MYYMVGESLGHKPCIEQCRRIQSRMAEYEIRISSKLAEEWMREHGQSSNQPTSAAYAVQ
jgi:hypothetical protein